MTDLSTLPWDSAAIVLWLPKDEEPDMVKHFNVEAELHPPAPNPEAWWSLGQALINVTSGINAGGKVPWVKVGDITLGPDEVRAAYELFKTHGL